MSFFTKTTKEKYDLEQFSTKKAYEYISLYKYKKLN